LAIVKHGKQWLLQSGKFVYALSVGEDGLLRQSWWGPALPRREDYPKADQMSFPVFATGEAGAPEERTLDVVASNGLRGFVLRFEQAECVEDTLRVTLRDHAQQASIVATYGALDDFGLISLSLDVRNDGAGLLKLTRALTGTFYLPLGGEYELHHLDGRWGDEFRMRRENFANGVISRESRRMATSHGGVPHFAVGRISRGFQPSEESGSLWFGALHWSGNWKLLAEQTRDGCAVVHLGLNDHDFAHDLTSGESLTLPTLLFGYTEQGFGGMSRTWHDYVRQRLAPRRPYLPPVVYNSWYATRFDVNAEGQSKLADIAAGLGVETFVIDDGWFSRRNSDKAGLGDWWPDPVKFPDGLIPLADMVHRKGMKFGIWIEPEMVNPDSDLYRARPDWIVHFPQRERSLTRNQSMLNVARKDVQDHLINMLGKLLSEIPIDFVKWDMNRNASEPGWPGHDRDPREIWIRYVQGVYRIWDELRRLFPDITWENCAAGGGRIDLGMMAKAEQSWISDTTVPPARIEIQEGYSQLFPAATMAAWVTDEKKSDYSLPFRFHTSMAGALGVGGNLLTWTAEKLDTARRHIAQYKEIRHLIVDGDLYRLASSRNGPISAFMYVSKDKNEAVLFVFRLLHSRIGFKPVIRLAGLDANRVY